SPGESRQKINLQYGESGVEGLQSSQFACLNLAVFGGKAPEGWRTPGRFATFGDGLPSVAAPQLVERRREATSRLVESGDKSPHSKSFADSQFYLGTDGAVLSKTTVTAARRPYHRNIIDCHESHV